MSCRVGDRYGFLDRALVEADSQVLFDELRIEAL